MENMRRSHGGRLTSSKEEKKPWREALSASEAPAAARGTRHVRSPRANSIPAESQSECLRPVVYLLYIVYRQVLEVP